MNQFSYLTLYEFDRNYDMRVFKYIHEFFKNQGYGRKNYELLVRDSNRIYYTGLHTPHNTLPISMYRDLVVSGIYDGNN